MSNNLCFIKDEGTVKSALDFIKQVRPEIATDQIQEMDDYHSGGGFIHLFFRLGNNRIFSFHCPLGDGMFEAVEISYHTYKSIDEYIDTEPEVKPSFGYEYENPNYEQRRFCMWCGKNGDGRDHCDDHS